LCLEFIDRAAVFGAGFPVAGTIQPFFADFREKIVYVVGLYLRITDGFTLRIRRRIDIGLQYIITLPAFRGGYITAVTLYHNLAECSSSKFNKTVTFFV
jgi:hypothetical protein